MARGSRTFHLFSAAASFPSSGPERYNAQYTYMHGDGEGGSLRALFIFRNFSIDLFAALRVERAASSFFISFSLRPSGSMPFICTYNAILNISAARSFARKFDIIRAAGRGWGNRRSPGEISIGFFYTLIKISPETGECGPMESSLRCDLQNYYDVSRRDAFSLNFVKLSDAVAYFYVFPC